jgi:hypothetical protein
MLFDILSFLFIGLIPDILGNIGNVLANTLPCVFKKIANFYEPVHILDNPIFHVVNFFLELFLQVFNFLLLILPELSFLANFLRLMCLSNLLLPLFELIGILPDILIIAPVHFLKIAIIGSVFLCRIVHLSLVLFEDLIHYLLTVLLVLPSVSSGVATVLLL